jgi:hypothetical protein
MRIAEELCALHITSKIIQSRYLMPQILPLLYIVAELLHLESFLRLRVTRVEFQLLDLMDRSNMRCKYIHKKLATQQL